MAIPLRALAALPLVPAAVVAAVSVGSSAAGADSSTSITLAASADTYTNSAHASTSYGNSADFRAGLGSGSNKEAFLKFAIPSDAADRIKSATLTLTRASRHLPASTVTAHATSSSWTEASLTAGNAPAVGSSLDTEKTTSALNTVSFDVTAAAKGTTTLSIALTSPTTDVDIFNSSEASSGKPKLVLNLAPAAAAVAPVQSSTPAPAPSTSSSTPAPAPSTSSSTPAPAPSTSSSTPAPAPSTSSSTPAPAPSTLGAAPFGVSLSPVNGETWAQAVARTEKTLGPIKVWRVYDGGQGATALYNHLKESGLLDGKHVIVASIKKVDAGITDLINSVDYLTINHEPDQNYDKGGLRVSPAQLAPQLQDLRHRIDAAGRTGKCKLMLILTGTNYATRLKAYMDAIGSGVVDVLGVDPYAANGTATGLVQPLINAAAAYKLPVAVCEIGMVTGTSNSTLDSFVNSLAGLRGKIEFSTWFNQPGNANLGNRLDSDPTLAAAYKHLNSDS